MNTKEPIFKIGPLASTNLVFAKQGNSYSYHLPKWTINYVEFFCGSKKAYLTRTTLDSRIPVLRLSAE